MLIIITVGKWMEPETLVCTVSSTEKNYCMSFILLFRLSVALADSCNLDERDLDQRKLFVDSLLILDLPTHLIVPSVNIKLNEAIGEGDSRSQCHHNGQYCIIIL